MEAVTNRSDIYGIAAEFLNEEQIVAAAKQVHAAGYRKVEGYSPLPVHGLAEALEFKDSRVAWIIFICGLLGCAGGFYLQYWINVVDYPLNVGGRPFDSWPQFIPVTFECTILASAFGAVIGMLALNGLPRPHHPIFGARRFALASQDRFFLCVEATDPMFDREGTAQFLRDLGPQQVCEVDADTEGWR
jgi:hypothetical protein